MLEPSLHLDYFPEIRFDNLEEVEIKRFDEIDFDFIANFLILDVQGYELNVIKGFGEKLRFVDFIYTEFSIKELYKNSVLIDELDLILKFGIYKDKNKNSSNKPQGDALFVKAEDFSYIKFHYFKLKSAIQLSKLYLLLNFIKDYKKYNLFIKKVFEKNN